MARQYCRWNPDQKMIGLRFSNVMDPSEYADFPVLRERPGLPQVEPVVLHRRP